MIGAPPPPADQRKTQDKVDVYLSKLEGIYSPELIKAVSWCLMLDPLARPQSMFTLQRVLLAPVVETQSPGLLKRVGNKWRNMFSSLDKRKSGAVTTILDNTQ
jgi:hypothetical protein